MTFRMIPTRPCPDGGFYPTWEMFGSVDEAKESAREFFRREDIPVMVVPVLEHGLMGRVVGVFGEHKLRMPRRRR